MPWTGLSRYTQMPHIPAARIHFAAVSSRSIHPIHMHMRTTRLTRLGLDLMTPTLPCCPFRLPSRDTDGTVRTQTVLSPFPPIHTDGKRSFVRLSYLWLRLLGSFAWRCPARLLPCPVVSCLGASAHIRVRRRTTEKAPNLGSRFGQGSCEKDPKPAASLLDW
jgi:hypothetical protein